MIHRPSNSRRNLIPYAALLLVLVVGAGGGYALASTKHNSIAVCVDKKTGILHLHNHGKCKRTQKRLTWNMQGPRGVPGAEGPTGQPGAPAVSVWAQVANDGSVSGQGLSVQHLAAGTYQVTVTAPQCAQAANAPVITVSDANPPAGHTAGFPVAWYGSTGSNQHFMVFTGVVDGSFMAADHTFTVLDTCT